MSTDDTIGAERILERRGAISERERPAPAGRPTLSRTPSPNRAIIAAAGARKTQIVVDGALSDPDRRVLLDGSGLDTRLTRTHARATCGARAMGKVP